MWHNVNKLKIPNGISAYYCQPLEKFLSTIWLVLSSLFCIFFFGFILCIFDSFSIIWFYFVAVILLIIIICSYCCRHHFMDMIATEIELNIWAKNAHKWTTVQTMYVSPYPISKSNVLQYNRNATISGVGTWNNKNLECELWGW